MRLTRWAATVLVAALAVTAVAADTTTEVNDLREVIATRLNVATGKEAKKLKKAVKRIDKASAPLAPVDLGRILVDTYSSKTLDDAVLAEAADVLACLLTEVDDAKTAAADALDELAEPLAGKYAALLARLRTNHDEVSVLPETDPPRAAKLLTRLYRDYVKALKKGEKFLTKQGGGPVKVPSGRQVVAQVRAPGYSHNFKGFALPQRVGNSLLLQGCETLPKRDECLRVLTMTLLYPQDSRETGTVPASVLRFQDLTPGAEQTYEAFGGVTATITKSSASTIAGTFSVTFQTLADPPGTVTITGAFKIKR